MIDSNLMNNVLDNLNVGIVIIDTKDTIILFNKKAGEMLQQDPKTRIGTSILRCHGEVSEQPVLKMIGDLKEKIMPHYEGWVNFKGRMLYEYIYPIWGPDGTFQGIVEELHDAAEKAGYLKMR